jgi:hypothetical protein
MMRYELWLRLNEYASQSLPLMPANAWHPVFALGPRFRGDERMG